ncbi:MAG: hypothetical protein IJJ69_04020 [Oscillospiraceae bacterium]|nr:hypothetical protein [Oscillospiraceae bacterium]
MIQNIIITVLTSSGIIGIFTQFLLNRLKASEQKQQALELGVQALLRDRLIHQYEKYKSRGYAPIYAKENFENLYEQYHKLGANGVMDSIHEEFKNLPVSGGDNL